MVAKKTCFVMTIRVFIEASCEVANSAERVYKGSECGQFVKTELGGMVLHTLTRGIYTYGGF